MEQLFRGHTPTLAFIQKFVHSKKLLFYLDPIANAFNIGEAP